MFAYISVANEI